MYRLLSSSFYTLLQIPVKGSQKYFLVTSQRMSFFSMAFNVILVSVRVGNEAHVDGTAPYFGFYKPKMVYTLYTKQHRNLVRISTQKTEIVVFMGMKQEKSKIYIDNTILDQVKASRCLVYNIVSRRER
jgi:hypothetical protein